MHHTTTRRPFALAGALVTAGLVATGCTKPDGAATPMTGQQLYAACASCHSDTGAGNPAIAAPSIAGLPAWYVEAQLVKFRTGIRGAHPDDIEGLRMRPMSRQMMNAGEVTRVSEYVASLAPTKPPKTLDGDATAGAAAYATCLACHGPNGAGNEALKAPPIAGQSDWYLLAQLKKFKAGIRGANPKDISGGTMRPMSMTLADEQAMKNVVAHISTLSR
jgi:cytochrome c553